LSVWSPLRDHRLTAEAADMAVPTTTIAHQ
jgi:hypothetical protein